MKTTTFLKLVSASLIFSTRELRRKLLCCSLTSVYMMAGIISASAQNWHSLKQGFPASNAKAVYGEGTHIVAGNESGLIGTPIYYKPDSGTAFASATLPFATLNYVYIPEIVKCQGNLFTGMEAHGIYQSSDLGQNWGHTGQIQIIYGLYSDGTDLYASVGAGSGTPMVSTDAGTTWAAIPNYGGLAIALSFLKYNGTLFVGANDGLQYTSDNGTIWHAITSPSEMAGTQIYNIVQLNGNLYVSSGHGVFKSTDNGVTWTNVLVDYVWYLKAVDTVLLAGTNSRGIKMSDKNGGNWHAINTGLPHVDTNYDRVNCISFNDQFVIASVEGDSSIYVTSLASLGLSAGSSTGVAAQQKMKGTIIVSPNPSSGVFTIKWNDNKKGTLKVYDINARLILTKEQVSANDQIDMRTLGAGNYLLMLKTTEGDYAQKLSVIK